MLQFLAAWASHHIQELTLFLLKMGGVLLVLWALVYQDTNKK